MTVSLRGLSWDRVAKRKEWITDAWNKMKNYFYLLCAKKWRGSLYAVHCTLYTRVSLWALCWSIKHSNVNSAKCHIIDVIRCRCQPTILSWMLWLCWRKTCRIIWPRSGECRRRHCRRNDCYRRSYSCSKRSRRKLFNFSRLFRRPLSRGARVCVREAIIPFVSRFSFTAIWALSIHRRRRIILIVKFVIPFVWVVLVRVVIPCPLLPVCLGKHDSGCVAMHHVFLAKFRFHGEVVTTRNKRENATDTWSHVASVLFAIDITWCIITQCGSFTSNSLLLFDRRERSNFANEFNRRTKSIGNYRFDVIRFKWIVAATAIN